MADVGVNAFFSANLKIFFSCVHRFPFKNKSGNREAGLARRHPPVESFRQIRIHGEPIVSSAVAIFVPGVSPQYGDFQIANGYRTFSISLVRVIGPAVSTNAALFWRWLRISFRILYIYKTHDFFPDVSQTIILPHGIRFDLQKIG